MKEKVRFMVGQKQTIVSKKIKIKIRLKLRRYLLALIVIHFYDN